MSTQEVLDHHLAAFGAGDVDGVLEDYTDASVLITPRGVVRGLDQLRAAFGTLFSGLFAPGTYTFTMDVARVDGDVAFIAWHADCAEAELPFATDTFLVRDGKIAVQTYAAHVIPKG